MIGKKILWFFLSSLIGLSSSAQNPSARRHINFDEGWLFSFGNAAPPVGVRYQLKVLPLPVTEQGGTPIPHCTELFANGTVGMGNTVIVMLVSCVQRADEKVSVT